MIRAIRNFPRGMTIAALLLTQAPWASAALPLDQLLEQTRNSRQSEARANQERETRFVTEREQRAALLAEARQTVARERARSTQLTSAYEANEKQLGAMHEQLDAKAGNLGEMFGVVRQVANDFSSVVHNSMISAQFPERDAFIILLTNRVHPTRRNLLIDQARPAIHAAVLASLDREPR